MSDWNRSGREDDQRRYGSDDRERRQFGGSDRWSDRSRDEQRSFGERSQGGSSRTDFGADESRRYGEAGRYGGQGYAGEGGRDYGRQGYGAQGYGRQDYYGRQTYGSQGYGAYGEGDYGRQDYSRQDYGRQDERQQAYGRGYGERSFGGQSSFGRQDYGQRQGYGQQNAFGNERLERVTDGETDRGYRANLGEHRGRGPKNYTRSDDRIREDINDRLSDDPWLDASEIEVQVSRMEVTLTGTVNSREDKRRAEDLAEQVSGVKHVQNNLRVQQQGAQAQGQSAQAGQSTQSTTGRAAGQQGRGTQI